MSLRPSRRDPIGHALRRGKHKPAILLALREHGPLTLAEIGRAANLRLHRAVADLHGAYPDHVPGNSLVNVGLVACLRRDHGDEYALTDLGAHVAGLVAAGRYP